MNSGNQELILNLKREALNNTCYLTAVGSGGLVGALWGNASPVPVVSPAIGALLGAVVGLIYASMVCKPISEGVTDGFMHSADFERFYDKLQQHVEISREQAIALATIAVEQPHDRMQLTTARLPINFAADLSAFLRRMDKTA